MTGARTQIERRALEQLDQLLLLAPEERQKALDALADHEPEVAAELHALLASAPSTTYAFAGAVGHAANDLVDEHEATHRPTHLGDYRVLELLGRGGMGEVFRGERADGQFQQHVAIKLLKRGMDSEEILRRFLRERQILAQLTHPGVARLLDGGIAPDGRPFFVLEEVHGQPITEYAARAELPLDELLALFLTVCEAVESAHQRLIVHRDLKPSNILVTDDGQVKLLDFGIAKVLGDTDEPDLTRTQLRIMTPAYAAPEQILGEPAATATDVYSLGVVLYELLTGVRPHERTGTNPSALLAGLRQETIERPSAVRGPGARFHRELAGDLDTLLLTALEPALSRRYGTVAAFAQDLRRFLEGRPIAARPATWSYHTGKFLRRHRVGVASATLAVMALLIALGISLRQGDRAHRAAVRAERTQAFLVSLFRSGDPWEGGDDKVTMGQVLDTAAPKLATELAAEPEVRAALEDALAQIYRRLGRLETAAPLADRSIAERRRQFGPHAPEVGWSLVTRAEIELGRGNYEVALATLDEAGAILGKDDHREAEELLRLNEIQFAALEENGKYDEGLKAAETALSYFLARFGSEAPEAARLYAARGSLLGNLGRFEEAASDFRRAIRLREPVLPADHPWLILSKAQLAENLDELGRPPEALELFEQAIAGQRKGPNANHPYLAQMLIKYGFSLSSRGRLLDGDAAYREALAIFEHNEHFETASTLRYLSFNMLNEHRWAEAADYSAQANGIFEKRFPVENSMRLAGEATRALTLLKLGWLKEAEQQLVAILPKISQIYDAASQQVRQPYNFLGEVYRLQGRQAEALAIHHRSRELAREADGAEQSIPVAQADFMLACDLLAGPKPNLKEARERLDAASGVFTAKSPESPRNAECLMVSALLALREKDRPRAERDATAALAWALAHLGEDSPLTADARDVLDRVRRNFTGGRIPPWGPADGFARR